MDVTVESEQPDFAVARGCALLCANRFFVAVANPLLQRLSLLGNLQPYDIFVISCTGKNEYSKKIAYNNSLEEVKIFEANKTLPLMCTLECSPQKAEFIINVDVIMKTISKR